MKPEKRLLQVGDIVKVADCWPHDEYDQKRGDVGVVTEVLHEGEGAYITFARTGPDEAGWGLEYLDILTQGLT